MSAGEAGPRVPGGSADVRASLLIGLACLFVYNANGRSVSAGDTYPTRYLPFAILHHHTLTLDPVAGLVSQGRGAGAYWMQKAPDGRMVSLYPVVQAVLITPLYLPTILYLDRHQWQASRVELVARLMEKLVASLVAALSASILYLVLRRRAEPATARLLTVAYAFGTTTWMISSQALWQHGMAQLLIVGVLWFVTTPCTPARAVAAGLLCGLVAANRPPDAILAAALGAFALYWAGRRSAWFVLASAVPIGLVLYYNVHVVGHLGGGYGLVGSADFFAHDVWTGLAGLLVSPTRGLLVFSPFLLFLALAWRHPPRERPGTAALSAALAIGVAAQVLVYATTDWRAGMSWGPRFLTDVLPLLVWLLVPVVAALRGYGRAVFVGAVAVAIAIEAVGAYAYTGRSDLAIFDAPPGPRAERAPWRWRNAPFVGSLRWGRAPAELAIPTYGSFERLERDGRATSVVTAGQELLATGWARAGRAAPFQVAVEVSGHPPVATRTFVSRPDLRASGPAGWSIAFPTARLPPGEYTLGAYAWAVEDGERRHLGEQQLTVQAAPGDLSRAYSVAAERLRARQKEPGYWLTTHTTSTRFTDPQPEMNTYLTGLLIDLLDPVASAAGLGDSVARARAHLTSQVEATGLVRYHGLPDGPGIGTLGCAITPDSDDTSLAWRIAPPRDRSRLAPALATLDRYQTGEGLYRTWLAPRDAYQCIDPGSDPNPPDFTIQMHVLQMLAREKPAAGRALCRALRTVVGQDRVWVYYARTPLVAMLRIPDLARAGCPIELPEARTRTAIPGQEPWVDVVRLLTSERVDGGEVRALLERLAGDDFARVREHPPLLYHNDLTASVSRYYWSEDVGYALWLRLAHDHARVGR